jgi:hypothetical protein
MNFKITTNVGVVADNTISVNENDNSLQNSNCTGECFLSFFIGDFSLIFTKKHGEVVGACCNLNTLPDIFFSDVVIKDFVDGSVFIGCEMKFIEKLFYGYNLADSVSYDKNSSMLLLGAADGDMCVRVCNNLYIILNSEKIVGVAVNVDLKASFNIL